MITLLVRRLALGGLTLWVVSVLIFAGTEILPGDVAGAILGQSRTPETEAALRVSLGLDRPAPVRYVEWLRDFTAGKIGKSLTRFGQDITQEIHQRLENTIFLASVAAFISVPLALLLGLLAAMKQNSFFDRFVNAASLLAISVPEFFIGYILIIVASVKLTLFPSLAMVSDDMDLGQRLYTVALPAMTLVLAVLAHMMRQTRAAVLSVLTTPYIETAILKGIPNWRIVVQHALPNAIAPIVTVVAVNLAYLVVGVVVVEVVFVYPGMGQLMVDAVSKRDVPVVQTCGLIFASAYVVLNMIADLLGILSNPRIRHPR
jgi:peptide/nickel transport system permease protein